MRRWARAHGVGWLGLALVACQPDTTPAPDTDGRVDYDTDALDTDPGDTDPGDIDPADTDPSDTDVSDSALPDTDPARDTADTDLPPVGGPVALGRGFVDLTTALYVSSPRFAQPVDATHAPMQTGGVIVDLDGDGHAEVVLVGTSAAGSGDPASAWVLRYDPASESLAPDDALTERLRSTPPLLGALVDLDGDGLVDALGGADPFKDVRWGAVGPDWGAPIGTSEFLVGDNGVVVGMADLDNDGWLDLLHGPGGGGVTDSFTPSFQTRPREFLARPGRVPGTDSVCPYVVGAGPLLGDRAKVMAFGAPCGAAVDGPTFFSANATDADGFPLYASQDPTPANAFFKQSPGVAGHSVSWQRPMGAALSDLNADGRIDLVVTSTASALLLFEDVGTATFRDRTVAWDATLPPRLPVDTALPSWQQVMRPWGVVAADVDRDGRNDVVVASGDDPSEAIADDYTGYRPTLFVRRGWGFVESGVAAGLDLPSSGQALSSGDLDGDGQVDFVFGGLGELPRVFLNRVDATPPGLAVRLVGTTSNPLGLGAWVQGTDDGVSFDASVMGGTLARGPLSEPLVFLAAGPDGVLDRLTVRWPSGHVQVVEGLAGGQVHRIVEPVTLQVDDADRHLPADGVSTVTLEMTPRGTDGAPVVGAVVFRLVGGTGAWVGSPTTTGGTTSATLRAPGSAGFAIVEVTVDGQPLPIRPKLWWDAP